MNRKFLSWTMAAAVTAFAAGLSACGDDKEEPNPGPSGDPSLTLTDDGAATDTSIKFTIVPENAEKVAYMVIKDGEEVPDAETLLQKGKKGTASKERSYTESDLEPKTAYVVAAVAAAGEKVSEVEQVTITTADKVYVPTITLTEGTALITIATFTIETKDADNAAYVCVKKGSAVPEAAAILSQGTKVDVRGPQTIKLSKLDADTEYIVAAVSARGENLSPVKQLTVKTTNGGISQELKALVGEWTASMKIRTATKEGYVTSETTDITFPVSITTGVNDWTSEWCAIYNMVTCEGFMDMLEAPIDALQSVLGMSEMEASMYYGPKWFITLMDDNSFLLPNGYNVYQKDGIDIFNTGYVQSVDNKEFISYICARSIGGGDEGLDLAGPSSFDIEVSANGNTITVKAYPDANNPQIIFYPSIQSADWETRSDWTFWGAYKNATTLGGSDIVLTRKSSGVAPMSAAMNYTSVGSIPTYALDKSIVSFGQYSASTAARLK